jgi:hypothetical protein
MLHSSKTVDKVASELSVWRWRPAPDPGLGPRVEVLGRHAGRQIDLRGVSERLARERLAAKQPPPAFLQIEPARPGRERDRVDAGMLRQPLLDGRAGVTGEVITNQLEVACRIGSVNDRQEFEVAGGVARRRGEGHFSSVPHPQGAVDPDLLVAPPIVQRGLDPVTAARPARCRRKGARDYRAEFVEAERR